MRDTLSLWNANVFSSSIYTYPVDWLWRHMRHKFQIEPGNAGDTMDWSSVDISLQWRYNEHDGVSNHRRLDCLLDRLFRRTSKKTSKFRVTGLCEGNSPVTGEFPTQRPSNAENVSIAWRHHSCIITKVYGNYLSAYSEMILSKVSINYKNVFEKNVFKITFTFRRSRWVNSSCVA